nr:hypothetical protein [Aurantimonas marina]
MNTGGATPTSSRQFAKCRRRRPRDGEHHLMTRFVEAPVERAATAIDGQVQGGVPAIAREVGTSAKCDAVVYDQYFLMVRSTDRMAAVQPIFQTISGQPSRRTLRTVSALDAVTNRHLPDKNMDLEIWVSRQQARQQIAERFAISVLIGWGS